MPVAFVSLTLISAVALITGANPGAQVASAALLPMLPVAVVQLVPWGFWVQLAWVVSVYMPLMAYAAVVEMFGGAEVVGFAGAVAIGAIISLVAAHAVDERRKARSRSEARIRELLGRVHQLAKTDALTGARNRRGLAADAAGMAGGAHGSAVMLDVDWFKAYNDRYGHQAGDDALHAIGNAIQGAIRREDTVYRYGGEEFLVLMPGAQPGVAANMVERIRASVERLELEHHGSPHERVTVSAGIAAWNDSLDEAVQQADAALYGAKETGRNRALMFWAANATAGEA